MAGGLNTFLQEIIKRKMIRKIPEGLAKKCMTYIKNHNPSYTHQIYVCEMFRLPAD